MDRPQRNQKHGKGDKAHFNKRPYDQRQQRHPAKEYDLFTGGGTHSPDININTPDVKPAEGTKTADFTIFYNIAFANIERVKKLIADKTPAQQDAFWAEYLWKAHFLSKNKSGYEITSQDSRIIPHLLKKVEEIRNYHSHIWHDNIVLAFSDELKKFVEQKYDEAMARLFEDFPSAVSDYQFLIEKKGNQKKFGLFNEVRDGGNRRNFVTREGRIFFLSFFLTTGQMNQFLQQRIGYKRADMPQFKIKRLLYTFYSNRDGSSITDFNHEDRFINTLTQEVRKNVFKARTAFKLISYLMDYPNYWGSKDAMPLFDENNDPIKNVEQLKQYIESRNLLPGLKFNLINRKIEETLQQEDDAEMLQKEREDKYRTGTIAFTSDELSGYSFHINFDALHRLTLLQTLQQDIEDAQTPLATLIAELKKLADNRSALYNILIKPIAERTEEDKNYLLAKENQYLRGGRKLTELGITFFELLEKDNPEKDTTLLANYIRSNQVKWIAITDKKGNSKAEIEPEPIQVYQQDFVIGTRQKFRAGNRFVFYTAKFLMDFAGDNWYWGMETFPQVKDEDKKGLTKRKAYFKESEIPLEEDYRLTLEDGHIYIALPKNESAAKNHEKFYQFAIGPNAVRYLATYIQKDEFGYAAKFARFLQQLANDLKKLEEIGHFDERDGYVLLEKPFIASYLKPSFSDHDKLKKLAVNRFAYMKDQWQNALDNRLYISRAVKNKMVMDAYRLFDWSSDRADGKFLRADEYNKMSVCHYSLHLKKKMPGKQITFDYLYEKLFKFGDRQPPIPREIKGLLDKAQSLDHLMDLVFEDRKFFFHNLLSLPSQLLKNELPGLCRKFGISVPADFLKPEDQKELKKKHQTTLQVLPFAIHPMLLVKHFFPAEYKEGQKMSTTTNKEGKTIQKRPALNLFSDVRKNQRLGQVLNQEFYADQVVRHLYPDPSEQRHVSSLIGLMNTTYTEDILLWWMAQRYLKDNEFTKNIGEVVKSERKIQLENLNALDILLPLANGGGDDPVKETLYARVLMHQLDDLMFATEKSRLRKAAIHYRMRCTEEQGLWDYELKTISKNQFNDEGLPDGTKHKPIPFQLLRNEMDLVRRTGQKLADYMLGFEKNVLQKTLDVIHNRDKNEFQAWLKMEHEKKPKKSADDKYHFNFEAVLKLAGNFAATEANVLSEYRNIAFHDDIPITNEGSFSWLTRKGETIRELLQINEDLHAKKDRAIYLTDATNTI